MSSLSADAVVIGAGPGGYVAAIRLAQLGQKVILVEKEALGGVCLNWGCIPSKALIYAASLYEKIQHAGGMGILVDNVRVDMNILQVWKSSIVKKLTGGIGQLMKAHNVQVVSGVAKFKDSNTLSVDSADGAHTITAKHFLIATGSSPINIPGFQLDGNNIIESRDALELTSIPKSMAIIGGGVIGLEIGILYSKLGTEVTVIEMAPQILPGTDAEIVQVLQRSMKKRGLSVHTSAKAKKVEHVGSNVMLTFEDKNGTDQTVTVEKLMVAVGRRPNSANLNLEGIGVKTDSRGFITVNEQLRSSVPHILAIGDVTAPPLLAHKASKEGLIAAEVINGSKEVVDYRAMPAAVFTDPEIATVGYSEEQAKEKGYEIKVGKFPFQASGRALTMEQTEGFVKVITNAKNDEILGVHMIGPDVAELIAEAALAIEMGATAEDLALTVHTHPTLPESLMEAAEAVHNKAIHIYQKEKPALAGVK